MTMLPPKFCTQIQCEVVNGTNLVLTLLYKNETTEIVIERVLLDGAHATSLMNILTTLLTPKTEQVPAEHPIVEEVLAPEDARIVANENIPCA